MRQGEGVRVGGLFHYHCAALWGRVALCGLYALWAAAPLLCSKGGCWPGQGLGRLFSCRLELLGAYKLASSVLQSVFTDP